MEIIELIHKKVKTDKSMDIQNFYQIRYGEGK